jgi:hypothetical protein
MRQASSLGEYEVEGEYRERRTRPTMSMSSHVVGKDLRSLCGGPAFHTIRKVLFIFGKRNLQLKRKLVKQI